MKYLSSTGIAVASCLMLGSCVDDKYDLSDIDTTVRVNVNDLVVPVNVDTVMLSNIFDLDDDEQIKVVNGKYVLTDSGTFNSDPIDIESFHLAKPSIAPTIKEIYSLPSSAVTVADAEFPIASDPSSFVYESDNVSDYILEIDSISADIDLDVDITFIGLTPGQADLKVVDMAIQIPKGLVMEPEEGKTYDMRTGELRIAEAIGDGNVIHLNIKAVGIDFDMIGGIYDREASHIALRSEIYVKDGVLQLSAIGGNTLPQQLSMRNDYSLNGFNVTEFSGRIHYEVDNLSVNDVELNDLPDFFSQNGTDLHLKDPQLYINVVNPLENYDLYAESGLSITTFGRDGSSVKRSIDNGIFRIPNTSVSGEYNFCISPSAPTNPLAEYPNPIFVKFSTLGDAFSGNGLPSKLAIELEPVVPDQEVRNFALGSSIGTVNGKYKFYAPLELEKGSVVVYSDTVDGWSSEELDCLTITKLEIKLNISSDLPLKAQLTGYPIDVDGNRINGVSIEGAEIDAFAKDQAVTIYITGEVKRLDGIVFTTRIEAEDVKTLTPDMEMSLKNIRPRVSGYYEKEL